MSEQPNTIHSACALDTTACAVPAGALSSGLMRALGCCLRRAAPAVALALSAAWLAPAHAEKPYSFWHSQPVKPGETVMIQGHGFDESTKVILSLLPDNDPGAPPIQSLTCPEANAIELTPYKTEEGQELSSTTLYVSLPKNIGGSAGNGVFVYCLKNGGEISSPKLINGPDAWFVQGDLGSRATVGGKLRVVGNGLAISPSVNAAKLALIGGGKTYIIEADAEDANSYVPDSYVPDTGIYTNNNVYAQTFTLANQDASDPLLPATYDIYVHNGHGGPQAWVKYEGFDDVPGPISTSSIEVVDPNNRDEVWTKKASELVVDVNCTGLLPSACDQAFKDAISMIASRIPAGEGGVLRVAAGTHVLTEPLELPHHTILVGQGKTATILQWTGDVQGRDTGSEFQVTDNPRNALVTGKKLDSGTKANFSISDLTLERKDRLAMKDRNDGRNVTEEFRPDTYLEATCIDRSSLGSNRKEFGYIRGVHCKTAYQAEDAALAKPRGNWASVFAGVYLRDVANTEISDSTFDTLVGIYSDGNIGRRVDSLRVHKSIFNWRMANLYSVYGLRNLVYTNNVEKMLDDEFVNGMELENDFGGGFGSFRHNLRGLYIAGTDNNRDTVPGAPQTCSEARKPAQYKICPDLGITMDGQSGAYLGKVNPVNPVTADGLTLKLAKNTATRIRPGEGAIKVARRGAIVQIIQGKGAGQWRYLTTDIPKMTNCILNPNFNSARTAENNYADCAYETEITIDREWDVLPDETSWVSIADSMGQMIFYGNSYKNLPKLQIYFATHDVILAQNALATPHDEKIIPGQQPTPTPTNVIVRSGTTRGGAQAGMARGWHYQVLDNKILNRGVSFIESKLGFPGPSSDGSEEINALRDDIVKKHEAGFWLDSLPPVNGVPADRFISDTPAAHVYRGNNYVGDPTKVFQINLGYQNDGVLLENNTGMRSLLDVGVQGFGQAIVYPRLNATDASQRDGELVPANLAEVAEPNVGVQINNMTSDGHLAQQVFTEANGYYFTADSGTADLVNRMLLLNRHPVVINLARSGLARASDGKDRLESRTNAIDGLSTPTSLEANTTGTGAIGTLWLEVDLRHMANIVSVVVYPRCTSDTCSTSHTQNFRIVVSEAPGGSGVTFSNPGTITGRTEFNLGAGIVGRYIRVSNGFKDLSPRLTEIEVNGSALSPDLKLELNASPSPVALGDAVTFTATVTNQGNADVEGVQLDDSSCGEPPIPGTIAVNGVATCNTSIIAQHFGTLAHSVAVSFSGDDAKPADNMATAIAEVLARLSVVISGPGSVTAQLVGAMDMETPIDCGPTCSGLFTGNASVVLSATPDAGTQPVWSGCTVDEVDPKKCTLTMDANKSVSVNFAVTAADLEVSFDEAQQTTATVGNGFSWNFFLGNKGPDEAQNVVLTANVPDGHVFTAASTSKCSLSGNQLSVVCTFSKRGPGSTAITIVTTPISPGSATMTVNVTSDSPLDPDTGNNTAQLTVIANPAAVTDVGVAIDASPVGPVLTGVPVTFTATVTNHGDTNVTPTLVGTGACALPPTLGPDLTATCSVVASGAVPGDLTMSVSVSIAEAETVPDNHSNGPVSATVKVQGRITLNKSVNVGTVTFTEGGNVVTCAASCATKSADYDANKVVTLSAQPENGYTFTGWTGEGCSTGDCVLTINSNKYVTANFKTKPDLQVNAVSASRSGSDFLINYSVKNTGETSAAASKIGFYLNGTKLCDRDVALINGNTTTTTASALCAIQGTSSAGNYSVRAITDDAATVDEGNEGNNTLNSTNVNLSGPDLEHIHFVATKDGNNAIKIEDRVQNKGNQTASSSTIRAYLSTDQVLDQNDVKLTRGVLNSPCTRTTGNLAAGARSPANTIKTSTCDRPNVTPGQIYYVLVKSDSENDIVKEFNEVNNVKVSGPLSW